MVADLLLGSKPPLQDVALGAIRSKLSQMNIGMAIGAIPADIGEDQLRVTLRARELFVSAPKGKFRLIVAEFRIAANGTPTGSGMAIFAWNR